MLAGSGLADPNMTSSLIQTTLGLLVVLAIIGGAAWGFKRFGNFQTGVQGKLKVVGGISLSTRERVVLLQVGDKQLVVGVTPGHIQTLHVLDIGRASCRERVEVSGGAGSWYRERPRENGDVVVS